VRWNWARGLGSVHPDAQLAWPAQDRPDNLHRIGIHQRHVGEPLEHHAESDLHLLACQLRAQAKVRAVPEDERLLEPRPRRVEGIGVFERLVRIEAVFVGDRGKFRLSSDSGEKPRDFW